VDDRRTMDREYSVASARSATGASEYDYSRALVAANTIDSRARSQTPYLDLTTRERPAGLDYSSSGTTDTAALYDVLSYTRNVLSMMGTDGNVKVNLNFRPNPPIYNYTPTHKHYHISQPQNYYVTQAAPAETYKPTPPPVSHYHFHYPTRKTTEVTTRKFYLPYTTAAKQWNTVKSTGEITTTSESAADYSSSSALDYRRSNRAVSEFRDTSDATDAIDYSALRSGRAMSEFRDTTGYERDATGGAGLGGGYSAFEWGGHSAASRARSARARSEFADHDTGPATEYERSHRRAKLESALEEDEDNYRRRAEERGASMRPGGF